MVSHCNEASFIVATILVLHGPNGHAIYVATEHIVSVVEANVTHPRAHSIVNTQSTPLYVRETPDEIAKMLEANK
jgi:hypothetical protein